MAIVVVMLPLHPLEMTQHCKILLDANLELRKLVFYVVESGGGGQSGGGNGICCCCSHHRRYCCCCCVMIVTLNKAEMIKFLFLGVKARGRRDIRGWNGNRRHSVPLTDSLVSLPKPCMHFFSPPYMPHVPPLILS